MYVFPTLTHQHHVTDLNATDKSKIIHNLEGWLLEYEENNVGEAGFGLKLHTYSYREKAMAYLLGMPQGRKMYTLFGTSIKQRPELLLMLDLYFRPSTSALATTI